MSNDPVEIAKNLTNLENELLKKYFNYFIIFKQKECKFKKLPASLLDYDPFHINCSTLKEAIIQIKMDINIMFIRRGELIDDMRMSEGKIAGAITYRLTKAHIIHIHRKCNICSERCFLQINNLIAILIGLDYINKKFSEIPIKIRDELIYTIKNRHVNQETLGLVFDSLKGE